MSSKLISTGQAARLCSVTPDTILKWIKSGRLTARRTAGGHYRIDEQDLMQLQASVQEDQPFVYCWEHNSQEGHIPSACLDCVAYRTRAQRCYEAVRLLAEARQTKLDCRSCDYHRIYGTNAKILVVTANPDLTAHLRQAAASVPVDLEIADGEYSCSALVESLRPDLAIIDASLGLERSQALRRCLEEDPRIPGVRVMLTSLTMASAVEDILGGLLGCGGGVG